ncbi:calcium homeostasis modulator protein 5 [Lissotriton helveticus]
MDGLKNVFEFVVERKTAIGYGIMGLMTIGGQQIFSLVAFKCPCSHQNLTYGAVFLFVPALVLLIAGYFLNSQTWKLFTGCCLNPSKIFPRGNRCRGLHVFCQITSKALFAPVIWLAMALLNATFYQCAMSGCQVASYVDSMCAGKSGKCPDELHRVVCGKTTMPGSETEDILLMLQAQSQLLGWGLIVTTLLLSLLGTCYASCRSKVSYLQLTFWRTYIEKEKEHFEKLSKDYASKLAERNLTSFFENKDPEEFDMPSNRAWEEVSSLYSFSREQQYYSTMHRYVEHGVKCMDAEKEHGIAKKDKHVNGEQEIMLDFVDGQV